MTGGDILDRVRANNHSAPTNKHPPYGAGSQTTDNGPLGSLWAGSRTPAS